MEIILLFLRRELPMEKEALKQVSSQLGALYNLIVSVNIGLKAEKTAECF